VFDIGKARERVTIQSLTNTRDAVGQTSQQWANVAEVAAKVETLSANETYSARQVDSLATHRVVIRWRKDVHAERGRWRLQNRGTVYAIEGAVDPDSRRRVLVLTCYSVG
jgi:SPP1 family predicted phage head-tail adaptor